MPFTSQYSMIISNERHSNNFVYYFQMDVDIERDVENMIKKEESMDGNPWSVHDVSVFLKYCCPECDYHNGNLKIFSDHALENHVRSSILFKGTKNGNQIVSNNKHEIEENNYFELCPPQHSPYAEVKLESPDPQVVCPQWGIYK